MFAPRKRGLSYIRIKGISFEHAANGFPVPQGDPGAFCAALARLLDDAGLRAKLAEGASATALADFDIDYMVRQQEELYTALLAAREKNE